MSHDIALNDNHSRACECVDCKGSGHAYPVVLFCPHCGKQHLDEGEWATKLHKRHRCVDHEEIVEEKIDDMSTTEVRVLRRGCGFEWQPSLVYTKGVKSL